MLRAPHRLSPSLRGRFAIGLTLAWLAACGGGGNTGSTPAPPTTPPTPTPPVSQPLSLQLSEVASVPGAVLLTAPPGDTRQFIVDRGGQVLVMDNGAVSPTPFLDITARVLTTGEGGLLSIAFDPQYASNGYFYLYYTDLTGDIVIARMHALNGAQADPQSRLELLRIPHPTYNNHYGGLLAFGPDGYLYAGTGDGGGAGDPQRNGQYLNSLLGKMLRIDVSLSSAGVPYAIPSTNPYAGQAGRRGEIWAAGLRNPWRYSFDNNLIYIADVGQSRREEVNITPAGTLANPAAGALNFGWNTMEGTQCYNGAACNQTGLTLPAYEYDHGANNVNGCSITGGFVYRGAALPELTGRYFFSDYCGCYLRTLTYAGGTASATTDWPVANVGGVVSFGRDGAGELYVIASSGKIYKIVRRPA